MVKLSQTILVRSYSFADIMTRDKYVAFKIVSVDQGIFYKAAKIHSDIFNTCVDMMRQKMSTLADFGKTEHRENNGYRSDFIKNMPAAYVLKCIFITVFWGSYQWQYMCHLEENIAKYQPIDFFIFSENHISNPYVLP